MLGVMPKAIVFRSIPLTEIPLRSRPAPKGSPKKSQWDAALAELTKHRGAIALKVFAASKKERTKLKSALQMTARNRGLSVKVLNDALSNNFYAWMMPATTTVKIR